MNNKKDYVKIAIERDVANRLKEKVRIGETYTSVLNELLNYKEKQNTT